MIESAVDRLIALVPPVIRGDEVVGCRIHVPGDLVRELRPADARSLARILVELADEAEEVDSRAVPHAEAFLREVSA